MLSTLYKIDFILLLVVLVLVLGGLILIYSASSFKAQTAHHDSHYFLKQHLMRVIFGLLLMLLVMHVDYHFLQRIAPILFLMAVILLIYVLIKPSSASMKGIRRWIDIFGINFQPSEFAKFALIILLAVFLSRKEEVLDNFTEGLLPALLFIGLIVVLVLVEPNMGTATLILLIATSMLIVSGANSRHLAIIGLSAFAMITLFVRNIGYQKARLLMYINSLRGIEKPVWQVKQSLISLGNGGLTGVGLGNSKQKLHFLPQPFTDFIYSILCEELGFIGAVAVALLFIILFLRAIRIAMNAPDRFGMFLGIGIAISITYYFLFNAGVSANLLPISGIPMPFLSYGGSSLMMNLMAIGILLNISSQQQQAWVVASRRRRKLA
jgi:cell division protein FtsW